MNEVLLKDTAYLQRLLNFAGYDCGTVDGIRGRKTNNAIEQWLLDEDKYIKRYGKLDDRSEKNLQTIIPFLQRDIRRWFKEKVTPWMQKNNVVVKIICGTRTYAEQDTLYAKGRTAPGPKVTNAKGGYSLHNFSVAIDVGIFSASGKYFEDDTWYKKLVDECGCPDEMLNGGDWKSLKDYPHYQYDKYGSSSKKIREVFGK
jgi:peptidoglycan L-alanyl-D-glutamate endopeptidase CwlK